MESAAEGRLAKQLRYSRDVHMENYLFTFNKSCCFNFHPPPQTVLLTLLLLPINNVILRDSLTLLQFICIVRVSELRALMVLSYHGNTNSQVCRPVFVKVLTGSERALPFYQLTDRDPLMVVTY